MNARPGAGGMSTDAMLRGGVKALVVVGDNPMMLATDTDSVEAALKGLDCLITIDSLQTDTAALAHVAFADLTMLAKDGTHVTADRRIVQLSRGEAPIGDQRDALAALSALAASLAARLGKPYDTSTADAASFRDRIAREVAGYAGIGSNLESGSTRVLPNAATTANLQTVTIAASTIPNGRLLLTTGRSLYTSRDAAAIHSPEADKLHREEFLELNPADAARLGIGQNRPVIVVNGSHELTLSAALTDAVAPGSAYLPLYYEGGLVNRLLHADGTPTAISVRPA
jgi:predicted molibdopterin-dependent oxidoreductase YjgC